MNDLRGDNTIDSRDVIERIAELESKRDDFDAEDDTTWEYNNPEDAEELAALQALQDEASQYSDDWTYGSQLIKAEYFVDYCQELVSDIGDLPRNIPGYLVIDWDATAENIKEDYTEVDFAGDTYFVR